MGYLKGFFTALGITFPSFLFIQIYLEGVTVANYFTDIFTGQWYRLMEAFEAAIMEPIKIFFEPPEGIRITLAILPWIFAAFLCSFFYRKKHSARGGLFTIISLYLIIEIINHLVYQGLTFDSDIFTQPNMFYGYLVIIGITTIVGLFSGLISPFKKGDAIKIKQTKRSKPTLPVFTEQEDYSTSPSYYMPTESPSRDAYMETHQIPSERARPVNCEYCGSYLDTDSDFCSVCGNRVTTDY